MARPSLRCAHRPLDVGADHPRERAERGTALVVDLSAPAGAGAIHAAGRARDHAHRGAGRELGDAAPEGDLARGAVHLVADGLILWNALPRRDLVLDVGEAGGTLRSLLPGRAGRT